MRLTILTSDGVLLGSVMSAFQNQPSRFGPTHNQCSHRFFYRTKPQQPSWRQGDCPTGDSRCGGGNEKM